MQDTVTTDVLVRRLEELERRVEELERSGSRPRSRSSTGGGAVDISTATWTTPYVVADLTISETWIEIHEHSARPQLQRLIRETVHAEGPITDRLLLERLRVAWGLSRAGGRVQEAVAQATKQLVARGLVEHLGDALVAPGETSVDVIRVPTDDDATRRSADQVSLVELAAGLRLAVASAGSAPVEDVTLAVAKLLGWTRRGGSIQERFEAALELAVGEGSLAVVDGLLVSAATVEA